MIINNLHNYAIIKGRSGGKLQQRRSRSASSSSRSVPSISTTGEMVVIDEHLKKQYEKELKEWANDLKYALKSYSKTLTKSHKVRDEIGGLRAFSMLRRKQKNHATGETYDIERQTLSDSIDFKMKRKFGDVMGVSILLERHGIFLHLGVSRKHPVTNPRKQTDWFNPIIRSYMMKFETIVLKYYGDLEVNSLYALLETQEELINRKYK